MGEEARGRPAGGLGLLLGDPELRLGLLAPGDFLDRALVPEQPAIGSPDRAAAFGDPDDLAVAAAHLRLKAGDGTVGLHDPNELVAARRIDIELAPDIGQRLGQRRRGVVAIDPGQCRIDAEILSVDRRLEDAPDRVLENAAIEKGLIRPRRFRRSPARPVQYQSPLLHSRRCNLQQ